LADIPDFDRTLDNLANNNAPIDLAECAIALAALDTPSRSLERYWRHIKKLVNETNLRHEKLLDGGGDDDVRTQLAALKHIIADKYGYDGDHQHYDNLQNANIIHVIDRRMGMPIALSILYLYVAEELGWNIHALNFPAHVVCSIEKDGEKLLFDPFNQCRLLNASDLRMYLKTLVSPQAELSADYYKNASKLDVVIRLQNNIKLRQIEVEDYDGAVQTVETMRKIQPKEYRLFFDAGILYARLDKPLAAMRAFENYIEHASDPQEREEALVLLNHVRSLLN